MPDLLDRQVFGNDSLNSDEMESDSSGNNSEGDEINRAQRAKMSHNAGGESSSEIEEEQVFSENKDEKPEKLNGVNILYQMEKEEDPGFAPKEDLSDAENFSKPASVKEEELKKPEITLKLQQSDQEESKKDKILGMKPNKSDFDQKITKMGQTARSHVSAINSHTEEDSLTGLENQLEVGTSIQGVNPNNLNITNTEDEELPKTKSEHTPE